MNFERASLFVPLHIYLVLHFVVIDQQVPVEESVSTGIGASVPHTVVLSFVMITGDFSGKRPVAEAASVRVRIIQRQVLTDISWFIRITNRRFDQRAYNMYTLWFALTGLPTSCSVGLEKENVV